MHLLDNFFLVEKGNLSFLFTANRYILNLPCKQILFLGILSSLKEELQFLAYGFFFFLADTYITSILCLVM